MNIVEVVENRARLQPGLPAILSDDRSLTYAGLMDLVTRLSGDLSRAGIQAGDLVAMVVPALQAHVALTLALARLGAVSMPLSNANTVYAAGYGAKLLIHYVPQGVRIESPGVRQLSLAALAAKGGGQFVPMADAAPEALLRVSLSSGTTGRPKAITATHGRTILRCELSQDMYPGGPDERMMVALGLDMSFSLTYWLRTLTTGGALVRTPAMFSEATRGVLRRHKVTFLLTSPINAMTLAGRAGQSPSTDSGPLPDLNTLCIGGAVVTPGMRDAIGRHLCPNIHVHYGTSETGVVAILDPALHRLHPSCAGRLLPWVEAYAAGPAGEQLPAGSEGLLRVRSRTLANGYLHPASDAQPGGFEDGWFQTNDRGLVTSDGLVFLKGRGDDVLNVAGVKVDPARIEEVIDREPGIVESAVFLRPGERGAAPVLLALIVAPHDVDVGAVKKRCADVLGAPLTPHSLVKVPSLPRNAAGKLMRDQLNAMVGRRDAGIVIAASPRTLH